MKLSKFVSNHRLCSTAAQAFTTDAMKSATQAMNKFTVERVKASLEGSPYILSNSAYQDIAQYIKKEVSSIYVLLWSDAMLT